MQLKNGRYCVQNLFEDVGDPKLKRLFCKTPDYPFCVQKGLFKLWFKSDLATHHHSIFDFLFKAHSIDSSSHKKRIVCLNTTHNADKIIKSLIRVKREDIVEGKTVDAVGSEVFSVESTAVDVKIF